MRDQAQQRRQGDHNAEPLAQRAADRVVQGRLRAQQNEGNRPRKMNALVT